MMKALTKQKQQKDETKVCPKCKNPGERHAIEILPDNGTLWMIIHDDGTTCRWAHYKRMQDMLKPKRHDPNPKPIICPKCGDKGRVNSSIPNDEKIPEAERRMYVRYSITHEKIGGEWGKKDKVAKTRKCQTFTQDERDKILKQLNRYISTPKGIEVYKREKQYSLELRKLFKDATKLVGKYITLAKQARALWNQIRVKGMAEGYTEQYLQDDLTTILEKELNKNQIYYLFHQEEIKEKSNATYQNLKSLNIQSNVDNNDTEQSSSPSTETETTDIPEEESTTISEPKTDTTFIAQIPFEQYNPKDLENYDIGFFQRMTEYIYNKLGEQKFKELVDGGR